MTFQLEKKNWKLEKLEVNIKKHVYFDVYFLICLSICLTTIG